MYFEQFGDLHECIVEYDKYTGSITGVGEVVNKFDRKTSRIRLCDL